MTPLQLRIRTENELRILFKQHHEFKRRSYPEWASYDGDHRYDDQLTDLSHDATAERTRKNRGFLRQLQQLPVHLLSAEEQRNARLFEQMLQQDIDAFQLGLHFLCIDQQEGMHLKFPQWAEIHPLETYGQYQQYFSRLKGFSKQVSDTLQNLEMGRRRGVMHPRCVVAQSLLQMKTLATQPCEQMPLYLPILNHADDLSAELAIRVKAVTARLITEHVQPAYQQLADFVEHDYLPHCPEAVGLCHLKTGEDLYHYWVERHVQRGMSVQHIHDTGLQEIVHLKERLNEVLKWLDMPYRAEIPAHWKALRQELMQNPAYYYTSEEQLLTDYAQMLERAEAALPDYFSALPRTSCELRALEPWRAAAAPQAYYYAPPQDLSRPGIYYVNTHALSERPRYAMMALTLHEAVPGHHLQLARALETPRLPDFRYHLECTAFVEGWALYAEALGFEMGLYDELQALGALGFELWRSSRLVVDTGIHALGWTREQACNYLRDNTLQSETDIQSEVDRYIALPAQALAYKMGERRIRQWRAQAESTLGADFNLRDFHEVLLQSGSLPLDELQRDMSDYLKVAI